MSLDAVLPILFLVGVVTAAIMVGKLLSGVDIDEDFHK